MNSYYVSIHILFAVIMYAFIYIFAVQNKSCKHARAARAKPELTSCPNQAAPSCPDR